MIKFDCEYEEKSLDYFQQEYRKRIKPVFVSTTIVSVIIMLVISIVAQVKFQVWYIYLSVPTSILALWLPYFHIHKNTYYYVKKEMPKYIEFNNESQIEFFYLDDKLGSDVYSFNDVTMVYDYDSFYAVEILHNPYYHLVLQKNLIIEGSIEEFEKLFEGKIVKKGLEVTE